MAANLFKPSWCNADQREVRCILQERIGGPGQYQDRLNNEYSFYLPIAGSSCQITLTYSKGKRIVGIEPGPAFDSARWAQVVDDIELPGPTRIGRDISFSSYRVHGSWRGKQSGVQILPPPVDAPSAPVELAEHPFLLEFPVQTNERWAITNFRRMREHRKLTLLLNILLAGHATHQPRRPRHLWAMTPGESQEVKWVQEFYFANFGEIMLDELSPPAAERIEEIDSEKYYARPGHDCRPLRVPTDLDESICCYAQLSAENRTKFDRAGFWMDMAARQWTMSFSACFASLAIAVEALTPQGKTRPTAKFREFIEKYAPGAALETRRKEMYSLRSDIVHGSALMQMDQDAYFGWDPVEFKEDELLRELWALTQVAMRNWLKSPPL